MADGTAFTQFLPALNVSPCNFTGYCDWRLPTRAELETILSQPHPCTASPCIDPIFSSTSIMSYWSTTTDASDPLGAWRMSFGTGDVFDFPKNSNAFVRAVRGGL